MEFKNSRVRFRNNKPYLTKKVIMTIVVVGFCLYLLLTTHWLTSLILFLFMGLPFIFKIKKQPSEGKGVFGKFKNFYKNLYKNYIIDELPISIDYDDEKITICLHRAEIIKKKIAMEQYTIKKDKIAGIMYDDTDKDVLIMFEEAEVNVFEEETTALLRTVIQNNASVCFSVKENETLIDVLKENGYEIDILSEIENEPEETEDPELANTNNETGESEMESETTIDDIGTNETNTVSAE